MTNQHVDNGYKSVFTLVISGGSDDLVDELLYQLDGTPENKKCHSDGISEVIISH